MLEATAMPSEADPSGPARETGLVQRLRESWKSLARSEASTVIVGYSGGADSLALMHALSSLGRTGSLSLLAIHVDHGARPESEADAALASGVCERCGVTLLVHRVGEGDLEGHGGVGREEAFRRERYAAFAQMVAEHPGSVVALAHHEQDQAETVLLHLLRGAGIRGASGMRRVHHLSVPWWDAEEPAREVTVWRPFLGESRETVRSYALSLGLPVADDASNADPAFRRNAIRHEVLPVLERVSPGSTGNLARFAALASDDSDYLDRLAEEALGRVASGSGLDRAAVLMLPVPLQRRVVQAWLVSHGPAGLEVPRHRLEEVLQVASRPGADRRVEIGSGLSVLVRRDTLEVWFGD
jgi:tRNA(Ile)-lysidine synthase